jgi:hypothetical protein
MKGEKKLFSFFLESFRYNFKFEFKINECAKNSEYLDLSLFLNVLSRKNIIFFFQSVYFASTGLIQLR